MLRQLAKGIKDLMYPKVCLACKDTIKEQAEDAHICPGCFNKIKLNTPPFCSVCGRHLENFKTHKNICPQCLRLSFNFDRAFAPCSYEGVVKELIHEFKYKGKIRLAKSLSSLMIDFIREYSLPMEYIDNILPVPLSNAKLREREFNQAAVLSRQISSAFAKDTLERALIRHRHTKSQTDLEEDGRRKNIRGSFKVVEPLAVKNKILLLIDDVLTTGATSSEAAGTLKEAGANIVFVLTLAN
jgi:ComF family protein